jgi:type IV pilus assembly protein PilZ
MGEPGERRQSERLPTKEIAIRVKFADEQALRQFYLRDISQGGVFVRAKRLQDVGTPLTLLLSMPDGEEIRVTGKVAHRTLPEEATDTEPAGMGVEFIDLTEAKRKQIADYLDRLKRRSFGRPDAGEIEVAMPPEISSDAATAVREFALTPSSGGRASEFGRSPTRSGGALEARSQMVTSPGPASPNAQVTRKSTPPRSLLTAGTPAVATSPVVNGLPDIEEGPEITLEAGLPDEEPPAAQPAPPRHEVPTLSGNERDVNFELLRRMFWLLAEGGVMGRPFKEIFGIPSDTPQAVRAEIFERLLKAIDLDQPPLFLGEEETHAVRRVLEMIRSLLRV